MHKTLTLTGAAFLLTTGTSWGLARIADGDLNLHAEASLFYDSNIFANANEQDDIVAGLKMDLVYIRPFRYFDMGGSVGFNSEKFLDFSDEDFINYTFGFYFRPSQRLENPRFTIVFNAGIDRSTTSDMDLGRRTTNTLYNLGTQLTYHPSRRYYVSVAPDYRITVPSEDELLERRRFSLGGVIGYNISPNYSVNTGVTRIRETSPDSNLIDNTQFIYFAGVEGNFTPKLSGSLQAGWQEREVDFYNETTSTPFFDLGLQWQIDELQSLRLSGGRQFAALTDGANTTQTNLTAVYDRILNRSYSASLYAEWRTIRYDFEFFDREDDSYNAGLSLTYNVAAWGALTGRVEYLTRSSDVANFDYDRWRIGLVLVGSW